MRQPAPSRPPAVALPAALALAVAGLAPPATASPDSVVVLTEVHYNPPGTAEEGEWIELFNQMAIDVDLSGWRFSEGIDYTFPAGTFIGPGEYLVVAKNPALHPELTALGPFEGNLDNRGDRLVLVNSADRLMEELDFGDGGEWPVAPDGSGATLAKLHPHTASGPAANWSASAQVGGTPGAENFPAEDDDGGGGGPPSTTVELLALDAGWRYNEMGIDPGPDWAAEAHAAGADGWEDGPGVFAGDVDPLPAAVGTNLTLPQFNNPRVITYYFETEFELPAAQFDGLLALRFTHLIDDGAVFYLNGVEVLRTAMPAGSVDATTLAGTSIANAAFSAPTAVQTASLVAGTNRVSAEVHQHAADSSDIVFGLGIEAVIAGEAVVKPGEQPLRLNEIAPATAAEGAFFVELLNAGAAAFEAGGTVVSINADAGREFVLPEGEIPAGGLLALTEDDLGFRPSDGDRVFLYDATRTQVADARAVTGRLRGRAPARGGDWLYPAAATPGEPNVFAFNDAVVISEIHYNPPALPATDGRPGTYEMSELFGYGAVWRYNESGADLGPDWAQEEHPEGGGWESGSGPLAGEVDPLPVEPGTNLTLPALNDPRVITYYFERDFELNAAQLAGLDTLALTHLIDDGAVFYLNGTEVARFGMPGGPIDATTLASPVGDASVVGPLTVPADALRAGTNRISVEVHQQATNSSDIVFGLKLDAQVEVTPPVLGRPFGNSGNQWIELANRSDAPVDLTGWAFTEGIGYDFPDGTVLAPGAYVVLARDLGIFTAAYPGVTPLGEFRGSLSRSGERLLLRDAAKNPADEVSYLDGGRWPRAADGGGSSLELRDLDADNAAPEAWAGSDESHQTAWRTYTYRGAARSSAVGPDGQWREFVLGMLAAGEVLIDDIRVTEDPDGSRVSMLSNGSFGGSVLNPGGNLNDWRLLGNHRHGILTDDPDSAGNPVLHLVATGPTGHMHNHLETTLAGGRSVSNGRTYEYSFRARWVTGSNLLLARLYFNRLPFKFVIDRPEHVGTPGAPNSVAAENIGPTYGRLQHRPAVPADDEVVTVTVNGVAAPEGVAAATLHYSPDGAAFTAVPMDPAGAGSFTATIPGQDAGSAVQFYVEAEDTAGASAYFPARGPDSRAVYKVDDGEAVDTGLHNFRIAVTNADRDWLHRDINVMSNDRIPATVIYREEEVFYDVGLRLKGSERARNEQPRVGFNIRFNPGEFFRGIHRTVSIDRSEGVGTGQFEILFDVMIANSGGAPSRYYDLIRIISPQDRHVSGAVLQLARYGDVYLDSQFGNGSEGNLYEYELIYYPTTTDGSGFKRPQPDGVVGTAVRDLGDDPNNYRWTFLLKNNRERDDFAPIMAYAKKITQSGAALDAGLEEVVDVDAWLRGMAYAVLSGAGDNAGANSAHNGMYYARPDGRVMFLPHDMDFAFDAGRTIFANAECSRLTGNPVRRRLYLGHLHDVINTTWNNGYMRRYTDQIGGLYPSQRSRFNSHLSYLTSRSNNVLNQINGQVAPVDFRITTNGGQALTTATTPVTLAGDGWVNVRQVRLAGAPAPLPVRWTDNNSWEVEVPLAPGVNNLTLEALDFSGKPAGSDTLTVTHTGSVQAASPDNLAVSEIYYNPPGNDEGAEYIELLNIAEGAALDLTGVAFTAGVRFAFPAGAQLAAGERVLLVRDADAFAAAFGPGLPVAGAFEGNLDNGGETLTLAAPGGSAIRSFRYDDDPPWPAEADGEGASLVLLGASSNPDHADPANWRASSVAGGSPGGTDGTSFGAWKLTFGIFDDRADGDGDGRTAFAEYAFGGDPDMADTSAPAMVSAQRDPGTGELTVRLAVPRRAGADDIAFRVESSADLLTWETHPGATVEAVERDGAVERVTYRVILPPATASFLRVRASR